MPLRSFVPTSRKTAEKMLEELRQFFETAPTAEQHKVWDVLSALRGPDQDCSHMVKESTTAVIRDAFLGPNTPHIRAQVSFQPDSPQRAEYREKPSEELGGWHFWSHARHAFNALGLDWNIVNKEKRKPASTKKKKKSSR